ncbi:MAG: glycerol-3-phosphate acyltransferase [Gaiellales bacterium]
MAVSAAAVAAVALGYAVGCLSPGYYLVRLTRRGDLRALGTGSTGARNAGRAAGPRVAAATFALDVVKGAVAVGAARALDPGNGAAVCLVGVVAGHVWPVQLGFHGGRGLSAALGGLLVLDWRVAAIGLAAALLTAAGTRHLTLAGLVAAVATVPASLALDGTPSAIAVAGMAAIVLVAHRRGPARPDG